MIEFFIGLVCYLLFLYLRAVVKIKRKMDEIYHLQNRLSKYTKISPCHRCGSTDIIFKEYALYPMLKCRRCRYILSEENINHSYLWLIRKWNKLYFINRFKIYNNIC